MPWEQTDAKDVSGMHVVACEDERTDQAAPRENIDRWAQKAHHDEYLIIAVAGRRLALRHSEVLYVEAQSPYTLIYTQGHAEPIRLRNRLSDLFPKLPEELFIVMHVRAVKRHALTLATGNALPVSCSLAAHLNDSFDRYYQECGVSYGVDGIGDRGECVSGIPDPAIQGAQAASFAQPQAA